MNQRIPSLNNFINESDSNVIKLKLSEITVDKLLELVTMHKHLNTFNSNKGLCISLPSIDGDGMRVIHLEQSWGLYGFNEWKSKWSKVWGNDTFVFDFNPGVIWSNVVKTTNPKYTTRAHN